MPGIGFMLFCLQFYFALSFMTRMNISRTKLFLGFIRRTFHSTVDRDVPHLSRFSRPCRGSSSSSLKAYINNYKVNNQIRSESLHNVGGIVCREVDLMLQNIGIVTILEATASSQDLLVDMALSVDESEPLDRIDQLKLYKGDPYGAVLWPAASALAQYLLTKVSEQTKLSELKILELGTGTGLVSLVAALAGAKHVLATDYEPVPLNILKHAIQVNALEHRLTDDEINHRVDKLANIKTGIFDICAFDDPLPKADIMVAADIMYELKTGRALAHRVREALISGTRCIIACSPGRPGRNAFSQEIKQLLPNINTDFIEIAGTTCSGPRNDLICGKDSTSISENPKPLSVALLDICPSNVMR